MLRELGLTPFADGHRLDAASTSSRRCKRTRDADEVRERAARARPSGSPPQQPGHADHRAGARRSATGKILVDVARNTYGQTVVAPYAVRALAGRAGGRRRVGLGRGRDPALRRALVHAADARRAAGERGDPLGGIDGTRTLPAASTPAATGEALRMGFLDKAKKMAEQAQAKLDEVQKQFNEQQGASRSRAAGRRRVRQARPADRSRARRRPPAPSAPRRAAGHAAGDPPTRSRLRLRPPERRAAPPAAARDGAAHRRPRRRPRRRRRRPRPRSATHELRAAEAASGDPLAG